MKNHLPIVNFSSLLDPFKNITFSLETIKRLAGEKNIEKTLDDRIELAQSSLLNDKFNDYWETFVFFFIGEIETKIILEEYIKSKKENTEKISSEISLNIMKFVSFLINCRQKLVESLFELIINVFKMNSGSKGNTNLFFETQKFIIVVVNVLKGSYKTKNRFHNMIIDDIEVSLNSALTIGNFAFNIK
ncbi:MAG: hypothetical protein ACW981_13810 [Candidatus Hodarchaeales archaeon]|jgi:hypothetical protein